MAIEDAISAKEKLASGAGVAVVDPVADAPEATAPVAATAEGVSTTGLIDDGAGAGPAAVATGRVAAVVDASATTGARIVKPEFAAA